MRTASGEEIIAINLFICVRWSRMEKCLYKIGVTNIQDLYSKQKAVIRWQNGDLKPPQITKGVRQRCSLLAILFNVYAEMIVNGVLEIAKGGVLIGRRRLKMIKFTNGQEPIAVSGKTPRGCWWKLITQRLNMEWRWTWKIMAQRFKIELEGRTLQQVKAFEYLGEWITTEDALCYQEFSTRVAMTKNEFTRKVR